MIDWPFLAINFLWVLGLSTILAAFSYHNWLRQELGRPLGAELRERTWRMAIGAGVSLVGLSIAVMPRSERWWTRLLALAVSFGGAWMAVQMRRANR